MTDAKKQYVFWCSDLYFDQKTRDELREIEGNNEEIEDRFYKNLEFGTGGLRGVIGAGTNRMNRYTVRKASQGLANYILRENAQKKGVAIAYDSRRMSPEFARETALCMAANAIPAYIFPSLRPTPMLSFALRELGCTAGVVITASHNPAEYNGYKVYWEDGAQITSPRDKEIIEEVNAITDFFQVKTMDIAQAKAMGLYREIGAEMDDKYMEALKKLVLSPKEIKRQAGALKIVYTPLHGTGNLPVRRVLRELGFEQVFVVEEQELPDENFTTVNYPNPEDKAAFELALKLAGKVDADLVLATDPDADRLGIYAKDADGNYQSFTGNMSGMLILEYLLSRKKELGILPENGAVVTTIVSGKMSVPIAAKYGVKRIETLTGFKYIGEQIKWFLQGNVQGSAENRTQNLTQEFIFGYEESYGCLEGTHARDKDAVVAVMALCEAAAYYREKGISLCAQMENLFAEYGYFQEDLCTVTKKGQNGAREIAECMERLRRQTPESLGGFRVLRVRDYRTGKILVKESGEILATGLPKANVLYLDLEQDAWCCIRPSGTEPKIKFYAGVKGRSKSDGKEKLAALMDAVRKLAE